MHIKLDLLKFYISYYVNSNLEDFEKKPHYSETFRKYGLFLSVKPAR